MYCPAAPHNSNEYLSNFYEEVVRPVVEREWRAKRLNGQRDSSLTSSNSNETDCKDKLIEGLGTTQK